jgi:PAS domain S-box-containing protein
MSNRPIKKPNTDTASDEFVRLLLNSTGEGIYGVDLDGNCTFANPASAELLGFDSDAELLGKHMHNLVHHTRPNGEPYPAEECRIYQAFRKCEGVHADDEMMFRKDGSAFPAEYWSYPIMREGALVGCVVTFVDITERKRVESELVESHDLVRMLLDSTGEGIYGVDMQGNCTFANPACARLLGFQTVDELLGQHMHNLVHHTRPNGEPYPVEECRIYRAFRQHEGVHVDDEVMFRSDGSAFPVEYWSYPVERDGGLVGCVLTFVDITERRQVEEELRQTEKMAALGKMSAGLAHELNNPAAAAGRAAEQLTEELGDLQSATIALSSLGDDQWATITELARGRHQKTEGPLSLSALEASDRENDLIGWFEAHGVEDEGSMASALVGAGIGEENLNAMATEFSRADLDKVTQWMYRAISVDALTNVVVQSTQKISELVNVVKSYSYMDQAPMQHVDIHRGIEDTITLLNHKLKPGVDVVRQYDQGLPHVQVRGSELNQVWTNLIDNAVAAMGGKGTINVRTYRDDNFVAVDITDDGPGIPPDIQSRIFDPFFTTKDVGDGTGLGLDVARRIVTSRCGGHIDFDTEPGKTVFRVRIPTGEVRTND